MLITLLRARPVKHSAWQRDLYSGSESRHRVIPLKRYFNLHAIHSTVVVRCKPRGSLPGDHWESPETPDTYPRFGPVGRGKATTRSHSDEQATIQTSKDGAPNLSGWCRNLSLLHFTGGERN